MERFSIYEGHMIDLKKKITKVQNKCKKYGCEFHFAEVGEEFRNVKDLDGNSRICKFILVEAEGTAKINNWLFIASVDHTENGNIFGKAMTDIEIPERYRASKPICEHCNSNRARVSTFIIMNTETGEFKQVGKSCLMDFTNGLSASDAALFASLKEVFKEAESAPASFFGCDERYYETSEMLAYTAEVIRKFGYVKSDNTANSTKNRVMKFFMVSKKMTRSIPDFEVDKIKRDMQDVNFDPNSTEASKMAKMANAWINTQEASSDYMHNLKTVCSLKYNSWDRIGILVSLFPTFNRDLEAKAKKAEAEAKAKTEAQTSCHIGSIGDKIQVNVQSVKCVTSWVNTFGYYPTTTYLYKIVDCDGNVFTWKTSILLDENNLPKIIIGTIKEHGEFKGVKQTVLTRCKIK